MLVGFLVGRKKMTKCSKCHCDCHCNEELHGHHYDGDLCACDNCECKQRAEDLSYEDETKYDE